MSSSGERLSSKGTVAAGVLALAVLVAAAPAAAQTQQVGKVGDFAILKISDNGKFNRCAGSATGGSGMLRLAFTADRKHHLSIPGVDGGGRQPMQIQIDGRGSGFKVVPFAADKNRAAIALEYGQVDAILAARRSLTVFYAGRTYVWDVSNQAMTDVMQAVSNCVGNATSGAPAPAPAPAQTAERQVNCEVVVEGKTIMNGRCRFVPGERGSFKILQGRKEAMVDVYPDGGGIAAFTDETGAWKIGDVRRQGGCWVNNLAKVCALAIDQRAAAPAPAPVPAPAPQADTSTAPSGREKIADNLYREDFSSVRDWSIERYTSDAAGRRLAYCEATIVADQEQVFKVRRGKDALELRFMGVGSLASDKPMPVTFWYDKPQPTTELPVVAPVDDGFRVVVRELTTARAEDVARAKSIRFKYRFEGRDHVQTFDLAGAAGAMSELADCTTK